MAEAAKVIVCPVLAFVVLALTLAVGGTLAGNEPTFTVTSIASGYVWALPMGVMCRPRLVSLKVRPMASALSLAELLSRLSSRWLCSLPLPV